MRVSEFQHSIKSIIKSSADVKFQPTRWREVTRVNQTLIPMFSKLHAIKMYMWVRSNYSRLMTMVLIYMEIWIISFVRKQKRYFLENYGLGNILPLKHPIKESKKLTARYWCLKSLFKISIQNQKYIKNWVI